MPPRSSSNRSGPRGGRPPRGQRGGAFRGSQFGGPSSINTSDSTPEPSTPQVNLPSAFGGNLATTNPSSTQQQTLTQPLNDTPVIPVTETPSITSPSVSQAVSPSNTSNPQANHPSSFRGQPQSGGNQNRGRVRGRGQGPRGGTPASPSDNSAPISAPNTPRGQSAGNHGRARGGARGGAPSPSSAETTPAITATEGPPAAGFLPSAARGQYFRARGGHRGSARSGPFDSPTPFRGRTPRGGGGGGSAGGPAMGLPSDIPDHVVTFGAKRPGFGTGGLQKKIIINAFPTTVPDVTIYQYDVVVHSGKLPARLNMELFGLLQQQEAAIFSPKAVYDGQKIIFSVHKLQLGPGDTNKFFVNRTRSNGQPKLYEIILTLAATRHSELLQRFTAKELSHDENIAPILAALNVAVKMQPNQLHPFNKRSFYVPQGRRDIGGGIELWRGIFQSVRPTVGRLIVNIDLSTGMMYKEGPLLDLCMDFFACSRNASPNSILVPGTTLRDIERVRLQKFLSGVRVTVSTSGDRERVVRGLSKQGADMITFKDREGVEMTVAQYFQSLGITLQYPSIICALVGQVAMVPLELCMVPRGQFMRKEIPDDKVKDVLNFSTRRPEERLNQIISGIQDLQYGQSEYVRSFGMTIDEGPLSTEARVIKPPKLKYNDKSLQPTIEPKDGAWNMIDKKFYEASTIVRWVVIIYDSQGNFPQPTYASMVKGFLDACDQVGMTVENRDPIYKFENGQGPINRHLLNAIKECERQFRQKPTLIVVVLPNSGGDIYNAVKHFGDITYGIPTQCLKSFQCKKAREQYWNNVMLKVNVKLGGINVIPDPSSLAAEALTDPANPTIVMGADVMHPPPGVDRPSYAAIIGSVDSHTAKYVASSCAQTGRQEIINDMKEMCFKILGEYKDYQTRVEKKGIFKLSRLIFYRDGVSESQFKHVLELELPMIKAACEEFGVNPKITLIVVGKRHHIQFFPLPGQGDRSKNCFAGTVVDRDVTHPTDHDFYLLSHAGILGTSRPAHYSVLYDDSGFNADALQSLSYSLCHVYAPSTRAVSVPAPVYYADKVCSRAKTHFDPAVHLTFDTATTTSGSTNVQAFKESYKSLHANQQKAMYFA